MKTIHRLSILIYPYRSKVIIGAFLLIVLTAIDLVFPTIIQEVIDLGLNGGQTNFLIISALIILALGIVKAVLTNIQRKQTGYLANMVAYDLRNKLYDHIQRLSFSFHDHSQSGQLISRVIEDVRSIQNFTGNGIVDLIHVTLLLIAILVILFTSNLTLALISLLPMLPLVMLTTGFGQRIGKMFLHVDNVLGELSSRLQENVTGVQAVRAFTREDYEVERFQSANRDLYDAQIRVLKEWSKVMPTTTLLVTLGTILILWFGGQMVIEGKLTLGELVAFNSYMLLLAIALPADRQAGQRRRRGLRRFAAHL